ncbi:MAG: ribonuclease PH, partial [Gemmatimonadetes bacterium]|nr:ribonuclease PH [Gemmatimonadota bacterium]
MSTRTGRKAHELRPIELTLDAAPYAEGSCLVAFGNTHVLC